jgi:hypothetical protein
MGSEERLHWRACRKASSGEYKPQYPSCPPPGRAKSVLAHPEGMISQAARRTGCPRPPSHPPARRRRMPGAIIPRSPRRTVSWFNIIVPAQSGSAFQGNSDSPQTPETAGTHQPNQNGAHRNSGTPCDAPLPGRQACRHPRPNLLGPGKSFAASGRIFCYRKFCMHYSALKLFGAGCGPCMDRCVIVNLTVMRWWGPGMGGFNVAW